MNDADLPAIFESANQAAISAQTETRRLVRWELRCLCIAALAGIATWKLGRRDLDVWAGVGTTALLISTVLTLVHSRRQPEDRWYRGRAAAESAKTLAWKFAVGGDPFQVEEPGVSRHRLLDRLGELVHQASSLELPPVSADRQAITTEMERVRGLAFEQRRDLYSQDRLTDQIGWYLDRSKEHRTSADRWVQLVVLANVGGLTAGMMRFLGTVSVDWLGVAATVAGAGTAWSQLLQHRGLASSYSLTAQELISVRDRLRDVGEEDWPQFVSDAEEAISREHTMWLARRGVQRSVGR